MRCTGGTLQQRTEFCLACTWQFKSSLAGRPRRNGSTPACENRRIDVYRLVRSQPAVGLTEEEFATRSTLLSVTYDEIKMARSLYYVDTRRACRQPLVLRYAVRYVNAAGQRAAFKLPAARACRSHCAAATISHRKKSGRGDTLPAASCRHITFKLQ